MSLIAIWHIAVELGRQAMWPAFALAMLAYALNYTLKFRRENQKLKRDRITDHLNAASKANKLIAGLDRVALSEEEFIRVKAEIMQVAGIDITRSSDITSMKTEVWTVETDNYNRFNNQTLIMCFIASLLYIPFVLLGFLASGWHAAFHLRGIELIKSFSKSTTVSVELIYASFILVFIGMFLTIRVFCPRASHNMRTAVCWIALGAIIALTILSAGPSEIYLP